MGTVLEGQRDASGQMYMRNRMYDPQTGQFTQTDPIGIAGGLNTYGFAAGDPVSYSDPYGLAAQAGCPPTCNDSNSSHANLEAEFGRNVGMDFIRGAGELVRGRNVRVTIARHSQTIDAAAEEFGVDGGLIRAIIYEEQVHQLPFENDLEASGRGSSVGLGQMQTKLGASYGFSRQQLLTPAGSIRATARHIATLQRQPLIDPSNPAASIATKYNCGSCTTITTYGERVSGYKERLFSH